MDHNSSFLSHKQRSYSLVVEHASDTRKTRVRFSVGPRQLFVDKSFFCSGLFDKDAQNRFFADVDIQCLGNLSVYSGAVIDQI